MSSITAGSAALCVGIPCRLKGIRTKGADDWNHIYVQMGTPRRGPRKWIAFDASVDKPAGWEAPKSQIAASRLFPLR